jgi:flagellar motor switch protein FliG
LQDIEEMLHKELMMNYARTYGADTHEQLAEIFNRTDPEMLDWIFKDLEQDHPEAVQRIKSLMFTFDDVVELDPVSLQQVIRACDTDLLTYALKGANEEVRQIFLSNMSERGGAILRDSIESMGPVLLRDVDAAKDAIVKKAKELAEQGVIIIARGEDAQQAVLY